MGRHKKEPFLVLEPTEVEIKTESIKLDQLLKFASSSVATGAEAKQTILEGKVSLNGEVCLIRGKKIVPGDVVEVATLMEKFLVCEYYEGDPKNRPKSAKQVAHEYDLKKAKKEKEEAARMERAMDREKRKMITDALMRARGFSVDEDK